MSQQKYATTAERQQAYRQRIKAKLAGLWPTMAPEPQPTAPRKRSRPQRLAAALAELQALAEEYQTWLDHVPDNLSESTLAEQIQETIDQLDTALDALTDLDLPRVGGR